MHGGRANDKERGGRTRVADRPNKRNRSQHRMAFTVQGPTRLGKMRSPFVGCRQNGAVGTEEGKGQKFDSGVHLPIARQRHLSGASIIRLRKVGRRNVLALIVITLSRQEIKPICQRHLSWMMTWVCRLLPWVPGNPSWERRSIQSPSVPTSWIATQTAPSSERLRRHGLLPRVIEEGGQPSKKEKSVRRRKCIFPLQFGNRVPCLPAMPAGPCISFAASNLASVGSALRGKQRLWAGLCVSTGAINGWLSKGMEDRKPLSAYGLTAVKGKRETRKEKQKARDGGKTKKKEKKFSGLQQSGYTIKYA
ncbi:hypothetical protein MAPG_02055 [Magnaporthiopsis poae ATCC 64411]|uniref:Uncharacterized protein n=1 Tax=Magnaporthiopsis poae (strain ATCC 64411 / 73-15) TaxID=644358 RepID=A0A0C4DQB7_MAGP6|nr:hypothetical protein MAPG_02055 [Magnaporthiopsis poae ATCC 64411]